MINIQKEMENLFGHSCYCYSLAYLLSETTDIKKLTKLVLNGWYKGFVDDDGYISKPVEYYNGIVEELASGQRSIRDVEKPGISSLSELPDDDNHVVEYMYGKQSHFVVANRSEGVVFDPYGNSNTVRNGKPVSWRKYIF